MPPTPTTTPTLTSTTDLLTSPVDDATRRRFLGLITATGLLSVCGSRRWRHHPDAPGADRGAQPQPRDGRVVGAGGGAGAGRGADVHRRVPR